MEAQKPQVEIQMWLSVLHIGRDACQNLCRLLFLALSTQRNIKPVRAIDQAVAEFLSPAIAARVEPYVFVIGMAELLLALWPVVMDVNEQRWKEQASTAGVSEAYEGGPQSDFRQSGTGTSRLSDIAVSGPFALPAASWRRR